jgi:hypothetical protein
VARAVFVQAKGSDPDEVDLNGLTRKPQAERGQYGSSMRINKIHHRYFTAHGRALEIGLIISSFGYSLLSAMRGVLREEILNSVIYTSYYIVIKPLR